MKLTIVFIGPERPSFQLVLTSLIKETGLMQLLSLRLTKRSSSPVSFLFNLLYFYININ
jgi:hypothetical protein